MELRQLEAFVALAEELHFGRAATRLHTAQPHLSRSIAQLERDLGEPLFIRTTRAVTLTAAGHALLEPARRILRDRDVARASVRAAANGIVGHVAIGFSGASARYLIPALTKAVHDQLPGIELALHSGLYTSATLDRLETGRLDIGFVGLTSGPAPQPPVNPLLTIKHLWHEPLACAMTDEHPLAVRPTLTIDDLADQDLVAVPPSDGSALWQVVSRLCSEAGFTPRITQHAPDELSVLTLAAAGLGIAIMPVASCRQITLDQLTWRPLEQGEPHLTTALVWNDTNLSPAAREVLRIEHDLPRREPTTPPNP